MISQYLMLERMRSKRFHEAGLCCHCGKYPFVINKTMCQVCLDTMADKQRRLRWIESGHCGRCGKRRANNESKRCEICTFKATASKRLGSQKRGMEIAALYLRQKCRCPYTGILLKVGTNASLDHKIPISKGGTNDIGNLQWVHKWVNIAKHNYSEQEFLAFVTQCHQHLN